MDLLSSILNSMDKPPSASDGQKEQMKKQREAMLRKQNEEREKFHKFRKSVEDKVNKFQQKIEERRLIFEPMDQVFRGIIHDVAEIAGMTAYSFGEEGYDRYTIVYKKDFPPSEDEITTLRNGEEWNEEKAKEIAQKRKLEKDEEEYVKKKPDKIVPKSNYQEKYQHLIGTEVAKDAARVTQTNKSYGFVPSENKKDVRSIEQTLADIQSKKRQKLEHKTDST
ncbi:sperm-associated antigen 7 homolog [Nilaparvata lugens]|uniref:sperm-associated antigen 7 homolog n=1 Tax=Nilaparvata lugens TaxID=108931 RepID=UPI00193E43D3|nr:sperm-associated antigen 7 homolog [Nilaparvata lugens]